MRAVPATDAAEKNPVARRGLSISEYLAVARRSRALIGRDGEPPDGTANSRAAFISRAKPNVPAAKPAPASNVLQFALKA